MLFFPPIDCTKCHVPDASFLFSTLSVDQLSPSCSCVTRHTIFKWIDYMRALSEGFIDLIGTFLQLRIIQFFFLRTNGHQPKLLYLSIPCYWHIDRVSFLDAVYVQWVRKSSEVSNKPMPNLPTASWETFGDQGQQWVWWLKTKCLLLLLDCKDLSFFLIFLSLSEKRNSILPNFELAIILKGKHDL